MLRELYGSLTPPWDTAPGQFNQHDRAALAHFARDMPALSGLVGHYLQIHNVLDEFSGPSGPWVLFNLDFEIRDDALAPFPYLHAFYRDFISRVEAESVITRQRGSPMGARGIKSGPDHRHVHFAPWDAHADGPRATAGGSALPA